jgi:hypothetical protein
MQACTGSTVWWFGSANSDSTYTFHSAEHPELCLDDKAGGVALNTPVVLARCDGEADQRWF